MQLLKGTRWNFELATFVFIKDPCSTLESWHKSIKKFAEIDVALTVKVRYYW